MGAMQAHTDLDYTFVTAPHPATGPPDDGVALFYQDYEYYEWFVKEEYGSAEADQAEGKGLDQSLEMLLLRLREADPPFDGVLGFSQGANMATRLAQIAEREPESSSRRRLFQFVILIGGVPPKDLEAQGVRLVRTPSLHIHGLADPLLPYSQRLLAMYEASNATLLQHTEGHNIPSIRTGLYPEINKWVKLQAVVQR